MKKKDRKRRRLKRPPWIVDLILFLASVYYSYTAQRRARQAIDDAQYVDDKPTTIARRGTHCDRIFGIRRTGTVLAWADFDQRVTPGGASRKHEPGMQVMCTGPITAVLKIEEDSNVIVDYGVYGEHSLRYLFSQTPLNEPPITLDVYANGRSILNLYWGWEEQPINLYLADTENLGVASRWPFFAYMDWNRKRLSPALTWPIVNVELRCDPFQEQFAKGGLTPLNPSPLIRTRSYIKSALEINEDFSTYPVELTATSFSADSAFIRVTGDATGELVNGVCVQIDTGPAAGDWIVISFSLDAGGLSTTISLENTEQIPSTTSVGTLSIYKTGDDGCNPAHALIEMQGAPEPFGMGKGYDRYCLETYEVLAELLELEGMAANIRLASGEYYEKAIEAIQLDFGIAFYTDDDGLECVRAIRPGDPVTIIPREHLTGAEPEKKSSHWRGVSTSFSYSFVDRARDYEIETYPLDDDGLSIESGGRKPETIQIDSATSMRVCRRIAERRQAELTFSRGSVTRYQMLRESKRLVAGDAFIVEGESYVMRVESVQPQRGRERVWVRAYRDPFNTPVPGTEASTYLPPGTGERTEVRASDLNGFGGESNFSGGFSSPNFNDGQNEVFVSATRPEGSRAVRWRIHIEGEGGGLEPGSVHTGFAAEGTIDTDVDVNLFNSVAANEPGPVVTATMALADWRSLPDYTSSPEAWESGFLLAVIGTELVRIAAVQEVAGGWQLLGLRPLSDSGFTVLWPAGTRIRVFARHEAYFARREALKRLRWKPQPIGRRGPLALDRVLFLSLDPPGVSLIGPVPV